MAINRLDGQGIPELTDKLAKAGGSRQQPAERSGEPEGRTADGDRVELSREARRIAELRKTADALPEIREAKVAELRQALEDGRYHVEPRRLAEALLQDPDAIHGE